jgi:hypothetical protein
MGMIRPVRSFGAAVEGVVDRVVCLAGAVLFSQAPEFMQQYLQRLGGHLDEARRQLEHFREAAAQSGLTLDQWARAAAANADPAMARFGPLIHEAGARVAVLGADEAALRGASSLGRPFVFLRHLDPEVLRSTAAVFRPAVPTTWEGALYALTGLLCLLLFYHGAVRYPVRRAWRRRQLRRSALRSDPASANLPG